MFLFFRHKWKSYFLLMILWGGHMAGDQSEPKKRVKGRHGFVDSKKGCIYYADKPPKKIMWRTNKKIYSEDEKKKQVQVKYKKQLPKAALKRKKRSVKKEKTKSWIDYVDQILESSVIEICLIIGMVLWIIYHDLFPWIYEHTAHKKHERRKQEAEIYNPFFTVLKQLLQLSPAAAKEFLDQLNEREREDFFQCTPGLSAPPTSTTNDLDHIIFLPSIASAYSSEEDIGIVDITEKLTPFHFAIRITDLRIKEIIKNEFESRGFGIITLRKVKNSPHQKYKILAENDQNLYQSGDLSLIFPLSVGARVLIYIDHTWGISIIDELTIPKDESFSIWYFDQGKPERITIPSADIDSIDALKQACRRIDKFDGTVDTIVLYRYDHCSYMGKQVDDGYALGECKIFAMCDQGKEFTLDIKKGPYSPVQILHQQNSCYQYTLIQMINAIPPIHEWLRTIWKLKELGCIFPHQQVTLELAKLIIGGEQSTQKMSPFPFRGAMSYAALRASKFPNPFLTNFLDESSQCLDEAFVALVDALTSLEHQFDKVDPLNPELKLTDADDTFRLKFYQEAFFNPISLFFTFVDRITSQGIRSDGFVREEDLRPGEFYEHKIRHEIPMKRGGAYPVFDIEQNPNVTTDQFLLLIDNTGAPSKMIETMKIQKYDLIFVRLKQTEGAADYYIEVEPFIANPEQQSYKEGILLLVKNEDNISLIDELRFTTIKDGTGRIEKMQIIKNDKEEKLNKSNDQEIIHYLQNIITEIDNDTAFLSETGDIGSLSIQSLYRPVIEVSDPDHGSKYLGIFDIVRRTYSPILTPPLRTMLPTRNVFTDRRYRAKNNTKISYPKEIKEERDDRSSLPGAAKGFATPTSYSLTAIAHHRGNIEEGHYTAEIRLSGDSFLMLDDLSRGSPPSQEILGDRMPPSATAHLAMYIES